MALAKNDSAKFLIGLALRLARPGTGSSREFLSRRTAMKTWPDLTAALEDFDHLTELVRLETGADPESLS